MKKYLSFLLFLLLMACASPEEPTKFNLADIASDPELSKIQGQYFVDLQHDVISISPGGFEEFDTTYLVEDYFVDVSIVNNQVVFRFQDTGRYVLPELKYNVQRAEESKFYRFIDLHLRLMTTNEYRMKSTPNQVTGPAFRIFWNDGAFNNSDGEILSLFLRSQDPDSLYNIHLNGIRER